MRTRIAAPTARDAPARPNCTPTPALPIEGRGYDFDRRQDEGVSLLGSDRGRIRSGRLLPARQGIDVGLDLLLGLDFQIDELDPHPRVAPPVLRADDVDDLPATSATSPSGRTILIPMRNRAEGDGAF